MKFWATPGGDTVRVRFIDDPDAPFYFFQADAKLDLVPTQACPPSVRFNLPIVTEDGEHRILSLPAKIYKTIGLVVECLMQERKLAAESIRLMENQRAHARRFRSLRVLIKARIQNDLRKQ